MPSKYDKARESWSSEELIPNQSEVVANAPPLPDARSFGEGLVRTPAAFVRGLYRSPADVLALSDMMRGRANQPGVVNPNMTRSQELDQLQIDRSGIGAPLTFPERVGERWGRTAPLAASSMAGMSAAVESPLAMLRNVVIGDVIASMAEQGAADAGTGPGGQLAAGMIGGMVAPGTAADDFAEVASSSARRKASRAILDEWGVPARRAIGGRRGGYRHPFSREVSDAATEKAEQYAHDLNVSMSGMRRASSEAKRRMDADPRGDERFLVEGSDKIDRARQMFPDPTSRPLTDQILSDQADVTAMSAQLDKVDHEFRTAAGGRRKVVQADLEQEFENLLPNGSSDGVYRRATDVWTKANADEKLLWDAVPAEQMPMLDMREAKATLKAIRGSSSNASGKYIPDELLQIDNMGFSAPYGHVQALHSELRTILREAGKSLPGSEIRRTAQRVKPVADAIRAQLDSIPDGAGGSQFRQARDFTRAKYELFAPESSTFDALMNPMEGPKLARKILNADDGKAEAQRAVDILGRTEDGRDQLSRVMIDELFDESLEQRTPRQILIQLRRKRDVYRTIWGDERYKLFETLVKKAEMSRRRKTGTTAANDATGTGRAPIEILFGGAEAVTQPITAGRKVMNAIAKSVSNDKERAAVLREGLYDPELWQTLIQMPEPRAVASWIENWDRLVARARARTDIAARSAARASGSARDQDLTQRVNQALPESGVGGVR